METARKIKRNYTKRTKEERAHLLRRRLFSLKAAHAVREKLIARMELRLHTNSDQTPETSER